jgi:glucose/arabinose dehydrogenase
MLLIALTCRAATAQTLPDGFQESTVLENLDVPTAVRFAADGRIFVAEKSGLIKVFDGLGDSTPKTFADLRPKVHNHIDRGLLGLALHPNFPSTPYVYALYTADAEIGGTPPRWGVGNTTDPCPTPPGSTADGCVVSGRLSRLTANGDQATAETVLLENWCQQYPSHTVGSVRFGPDGALYVSGGDGASYTFADYGQRGHPKDNPCGDPPAGVGGQQTTDSSMGGALRSQNLSLAGYGRATFDGKILRVHPLTGAAVSGNPLAGSSVPGADRIVASGFRNPFRFAFRPGTSELWIGDVGWSDYEEINRLLVSDDDVPNFGWPCYEGVPPQEGYEALDLGYCEDLYDTPTAVVRPVFAYQRHTPIVPGEGCASDQSSISGIAFYPGGNYPAKYDGALFFADYSRGCIWTILPGLDGLPDPDVRETLVDGAATPVDLEIGPGGDLYYVDIVGGTVRRLRFFRDNEPPIALLEADRTSGSSPLTVHFDASASYDPDSNGPLVFRWDLDGDGLYGDSTVPKPTRTYTTPGTYRVRLRVWDPDDAMDSESIDITVGNNPPVPTITTPVPPLGFAVGDVVTFAGGAVDAEDGSLPASSLMWTLDIKHCPGVGGECHTHEVEAYEGVAEGSFVAPDHEIPSHLVLRLTATDSGGLSASVEIALEPRTVTLLLDSVPRGLVLGTRDQADPTPFERTTPVGSTTQVSAPSPQTFDGKEYHFVAWSDGGADTHDVVAGETGASLVATYAVRCRNDDECGDDDPCTDDRCAGGLCASAAKVCEPPDECHLVACDGATGDCRTQPLTLDGTDCVLRTVLSGPCDRSAIPKGLARRIDHRLARAGALLTKAASTGPHHERRRHALERLLRRFLVLTTSGRRSQRLTPECRDRFARMLDEVLTTSPALQAD